MRSAVLENDIQRVIELARKGERVDGRKADEMRPLKVEIGFAENAEGSAKVTLGETVVLAGLKVEVGTPYPDSQDEGSISVGAEALPLAHAEYESGRPSAYEVEVSRVIDRGLRESKAIDFKELCIKEGEAVWVAYLDIYALNGQGNLFDAGSIAALVTFQNSKMPKIDKENKIVKGEYSGSIKLKRLPLLTTFVKVGGKIFTDPSYMEEKAAEARFSVATTDDDYMSAMQKGHGGSFTVDEVNYMIEEGFKNTEKIRKQLKKDKLL